jgi:hypothetical protein
VHGIGNKVAPKSLGRWRCSMSSRSRRSSIKGQWAGITIDMLESPAYRALSLSALRILARLQIELAHRHFERAPATSTRRGRWSRPSTSMVTLHAAPRGVAAAGSAPLLVPPPAQQRLQPNGRGANQHRESRPIGGAVTGSSARPIARAAWSLPWPAMIWPSGSARIGFVKPNASMDALS